MALSKVKELSSSKLDDMLDSESLNVILDDRFIIFNMCITFLGKRKNRTTENASERLGRESWSLIYYWTLLLFSKFIRSEP
jgi:hypothetical protein